MDSIKLLKESNLAFWNSAISVKNKGKNGTFKYKNILCKRSANH